ncbi:porin family protein [Pedobacter nutrimenti]|uniref:Outer membrane protein with beta-barrel domain n=1 Tax=Pedobacter nutrimenti TaxID=1241337 RepID=A0A318UI23_9SPHI|nr:hypothetical protein [Pedobacter nutrimenti]PYF75190.1 hypothetical protein B0O44_103640 [Pedobacter nutrimenti]
MERDNDIDQLFKQGLKDPEIPFNELDWQKMEQKLDAQQKRRMVPFWLMSVAGVAAALLLVLFWIFSGSEQLPVQTGGNQTSSAGKTAAPENIPTQDKTRPSGPEIKNKPAGPVTQTVKLQPVPVIFVPGPRVKKDTAQQQELMVARQPLKSSDLLPKIVEKQDSTSTIVQTAPVQDQQSSLAVEKTNPAEILKNVRKKMEAEFADKRPGLVLSVLAAPDISTAQSSKASKLSSNFGVMATYELSRKFSVSSGAVYSRKIYNSGGTGPAVNGYGAPWEVNADCNVLDVPVNLNYKLLSKSNFSISAQTGLSSYFMLKENYRFVRTDANANQKITNVEINNQNQHLFGIANFSLSVERKISPALSIAVQPFVKLPLTGIGYWDANLKSTGVSFSLNIGLFPAKKSGKYASTYSKK